MAIDAATTLSGFEGFLNPQQAAPIFDRAAEVSVVQRLAQRVPLGISGSAIPVFTGDPQASFVSEGSEKPKTEGTAELKIMEPEKIATIFVTSAEVVRANPGGFMTTMRNKVAEAIAKAFDAAAIHGTGSPYDDALTDGDKSVTLGTADQDAGGVYADLVAGLALLAEDDQDLNGFALSPRIEPTLLSAVDLNGRPIFIADPQNTVGTVRGGTLLGRPATVSKAVHAGSDLRALGGDWTQAAWGAVGGISYSVSTEATVTIDGSLVSLWENNLVAVLAEVEYGFVVNDVEAFVSYEAAAGGEG
jgi:HK97 family phage major capsid protein